MRKVSVLRQFNRFLNRELAFHKFEDWVVAHLQTALDSENREVIDLVDGAESLLIELGQNLITEREFIEGILALVRKAETITGTLTTSEAESLDSSSADGTLLVNADFTGWDREIVAQFAFG